MEAQRLTDDERRFAELIGSTEGLGDTRPESHQDEHSASPLGGQSGSSGNKRSSNDIDASEDDLVIGSSTTKRTRFQDALQQPRASGPAVGDEWEYSLDFLNTAGMDDNFFLNPQSHLPSLNHHSNANGNNSNNNNNNNNNNNLGHGRNGMAEMDILAQLGAALNQHSAVVSSGSHSTSIISNDLDFPSNIIGSAGTSSREALEGMVKLYGERDQSNGADGISVDSKGKGKARAEGQGFPDLDTGGDAVPDLNIDSSLGNEDRLPVLELPLEASSFASTSASALSASAQASLNLMRVQNPVPTNGLGGPTAREVATAFMGNDEKPHECPSDGCDKKFARKSDFLRHYRIHTGERPFACTHEGCGKTFIQRSALTVHTRVHTGDKPHSCGDCQRLFSDSSSLARHRRAHKGIKPFKCEKCDVKSFSRKATLARHQNICTGPGAGDKSTPKNSKPKFLPKPSAVEAEESLKVRPPPSNKGKTSAKMHPSVKFPSNGGQDSNASSPDFEEFVGSDDDDEFGSEEEEMRMVASTSTGSGSGIGRELLINEQDAHGNASLDLPTSSVLTSTFHATLSTPRPLPSMSLSSSSLPILPVALASPESNPLPSSSNSNSNPPLLSSAFTSATRTEVRPVPRPGTISRARRDVFGMELDEMEGISSEEMVARTLASFIDES